MKLGIDLSNVRLYRRWQQTGENEAPWLFLQLKSAFDNIKLRRVTWEIFVFFVKLSKTLQKQFAHLRFRNKCICNVVAVRSVSNLQRPSPRQRSNVKQATALPSRAKVTSKWKCIVISVMNSKILIETKQTQSLCTCKWKIMEVVLTQSTPPYIEHTTLHRAHHLTQSTSPCTAAVFGRPDLNLCVHAAAQDDDARREELATVDVTHVPGKGSLQTGQQLRWEFTENVELPVCVFVSGRRRPFRSLSAVPQ